MTQKLANKLINHYEMVISEIEKMDGEPKSKIINYLLRQSVQCGICYAAKRLYGANISTDRFVRKHIGADGESILCWCEIPGWAATKEEVLKYLQFRVDILRTFQEPKGMIQKIIDRLHNIIYNIF